VRRTHGRNKDGLKRYVDYERNDYPNEWSFETRGIKYRSKTPEFEAYPEHLRKTEA